MTDSLLPNGLGGRPNGVTPIVEQALRAAGVTAIAAEYAEDPVGLAHFSEATVVWFACDSGLARCDVTVKLIPPNQEPQADPITLNLVPWSEVRGVTISITVDRPGGPRTTLTVSAASPAMTVATDSDAHDQFVRLQALAAAIVAHLPGLRAEPA